MRRIGPQDGSVHQVSFRATRPSLCVLPAAAFGQVIGADGSSRGPRLRSVGWLDRVQLSGGVTTLAFFVACANGGSSTDSYSGSTDASGNATTGTEAGGSEGGAGDDGGSGVDSASSGQRGMSDDAGTSGADAGDDGGNAAGGNDGGGAGAIDAGGSGDAVASTDAGDKCARYNDTCGDCTQGRSGYNCGWCNGCFTGTSGGPTRTGVCAGATWVWKSGNCP
jgi:hypothetical protein